MEDSKIAGLELGTPEAAVRSCVNLFARLFEQPEEYVACYLDMYYQLRRAWEDGKHRRDTGPSQSPVCALVTAPPEGGAKGEDGTPRESASTDSACKAEASPRASAPTDAETAGENQAGMYGNIPTVEIPDCKQVNLQAPPEGKKVGAKAGNQHGAQAAAEKRRIRERLMKIRESGATSAVILKKAQGNISQFQLSDIIEGRLVPIAVYRILDATLNLLEPVKGD